jgi:hypothetical protein
MQQSLPSGMKPVVENERAHLQLPISLLGSVLEALSVPQATQVRLSGPNEGVSPRPRTLVEPELAWLPGALEPIWFAILCVLYDAHAIQPNPVLKVRDLATRARIIETTIYRCVRSHRDGVIRLEKMQKLIHHFVLDIHPHEGADSPDQFFLRNLTEVITTCPVVRPVANSDIEGSIAPPQVSE